MEKPSMVESIYVTEKDIETHTWQEINFKFTTFWDKMFSIEDLNKLLNT
jgi:hypothetical protein